MDGITLYCIRKELSGYLPLKVQKIQQPSPPVLVFSLWNPSLRAKLVLSLEGRLPFFGFSAERRENPKAPSGFCLGLRKRLEGGSLTAIGQESMDRVLYLDFTGHDDFGNAVPFTLVLDMAGKGANIGLFKGSDSDKTGELIAAAMPPDGDRFCADRPYTPPEGARVDMAGPTGTGEVGALLKSAKGPALKALTSTVQGMGRDLALSVLTQSGVEPDVPLSGESAQAVATALSGVSQDLLRERYVPAVYETVRGDVFFHALPLVHLQPVKTYKSVLEAAEAFRALSLDKADEETLRSYASALYRKVLKKLESRLSAQWEDLVKAEDAEHYRLWGELLNSSGVSARPGTKEVEVLDYYKDPPAPTVIPLDPRYSSRDNARNYFAKYAKMVRAARVLRESTHKLRVQLERLKEIGEFLVAQGCEGPSRDDSAIEIGRAVDLLEKAAAEAGVSVRARRRRQRVAPAEYPDGTMPASIQELSGPDGSQIYVGGNAKANDYLVSKLKKPGDIWLHAKGTRGAHVLLRPPSGAEPSDEMMLHAARIAALKSQASGATKVEVDLVDAMRVKKPRGGAPGFVTYTGQKTVVVSLT